MNKLPQRGAARVSTVWMIVVIVLFFVSMALVYVANQAAETSREDADGARVAAQEAIDRLEVEQQKVRHLSDILGYFPRNIIGAEADPDQARDGLSSLRQVFPDLPESTVTDFERAVQPIIDAYRAKIAEIGTLTASITTLQAQLKAAQAATSTTSQKLTENITKLESQLDDATQNAADEKARLEGQVADLQNQVNQLGNEVNTLKGTIDDKVSQMERDALAARTIQTSLNSQLKVLKKAPGPDGQILTVSKQLSTAWIDRGAKDRVARGMIFEVRTGNPNAERDVTKGWAQVIDVERERSRVKIFDQADRFDPVVSGDLIYNPIFDPAGTRYATLIGRFSGTYNEAEVKLLLQEIGITVQDELDLTTNYLIVGGPLFHDEEGEPVEDPIQPSDLKKYQQAQAQGVLTISINDFRQYFLR